MSADIRGQAAQDSNVQVAADGFPVPARALRDGTLAGIDWRAIKVLEGKAFHVDVGEFSTPIVGGGNGTVIDLDQPEFCISVPTGKSIMPLRVSIQCQTPLLATDADEAEILLAVDKAAANAGDGTATTETSVNMRTDAPSSSSCTCKSAFTADTTDPVLGVELARKVIVGDMNGTPANALWGVLDMVYEPVAPPVIVGPAAVYGYWGGTVANSGFAQVEWIEFDSSSVT